MSRDLARFNRLHLQHRRATSSKAPQRQCRDREPHPFHHYERPGGLIWSCQGRGATR